MVASDAIAKGEASELAGEYLDASAAYESALGDDDPLVVADAHFHIGRVRWRQSRYDDAVAHYEKARATAVELGADELRARIENGLGVVHHARGELAQARAAYSVALELTADATQRGRVLLNLGAIANIQGDYAEARTLYARSRALFQQTDYGRGEAMALHNLGMLSADLSLWDEADEAYQRCLDLLEIIGDKQFIATVLLNRTELSCARQRYEEGVANADLALSIYSELGDEAGRGDAFRWKGRALRLLNRHGDARRALEQAIRVAKRTQIPLLEAEATYDLGLSFASGEENAAARKTFERARVLFEELGAERDVEHVRDALSRLS